MAKKAETDVGNMVNSSTSRFLLSWISFPLRSSVAIFLRSLRSGLAAEDKGMASIK